MFISHHGRDWLRSLQCHREGLLWHQNHCWESCHHFDCHLGLLHSWVISTILWLGRILFRFEIVLFFVTASTLEFLNPLAVCFITEGTLITCSYDYLTEDWNHKTYILYAFIMNFCIPMTTIIYFYSQIVKAVVGHEASLRAQAKKMNVESLRSNAVR